LRNLPRVVWLVVAVQTLLLLAIGVLYPTFQEPDEVLHVDYVLAHRHGEWFDGPAERLPQVGVIRAWATLPQAQLGLHVGDEKVLPRSERKSFDGLGTKPAPSAYQPNQMVQHPLGYYGLAAGWSYLLPGFEHHRYDIQVWWLRLLSVLLMMPVPILIYLAGRRLTASHGVALLASLLPMVFPSYLRTGASVSNDVLMVTLGAWLMYELAKVLTGDLTKKTAVRVGVSWGLMLLVKGFALVMPPVIVLAYLVGARGRLRERIRGSVLPIVLAGGLGAALGGWWWVRNELVYGVVQPHGRGDAWPVQRLYGVHLGGTIIGLLHGFASRMIHRTFGSLGLIDNPSLPTPVLTGLFVIGLVMLIGGVWRGFSGAHAPRLAALTYVLPVPLLLGVVLLGIKHIWSVSQSIPGVQVRYVWAFIGAIVLPTAVFMAWASVKLRVERWRNAICFGLILLFEVASALLVLGQQFGTATGSVATKLHSGSKFVTAWYPFTPVVSVTLVVLAAVASVALIVALARDAIAPSEAVPDAAPIEGDAPREPDASGEPAFAS
jgi:4-amino-4-deoxy-L-arabinose transferase-like glycosyltransferase